MPVCREFQFTCALFISFSFSLSCFAFLHRVLSSIILLFALFSSQHGRAVHVSSRSLSYMTWGYRVPGPPICSTHVCEQPPAEFNIIIHVFFFFFDISSIYIVRDSSINVTKKYYDNADYNDSVILSHYDTMTMSQTG